MVQSPKHQADPWYCWQPAVNCMSWPRNHHRACGRSDSLSATRREVLCSFVVTRCVRRQQAGSAGRCRTETQRTMNLFVLAWAAIHSQTWRWQDDHPRNDLSVYSDLMTCQENLRETRRSQRVERGCRPATEQGSLHGRQEHALLLPEGSFAC